MNFQTNGFSVTPASQTQLWQVAGKLKACPDVKVSVIGHTDNSGDDAINIPLSGNPPQSRCGLFDFAGCPADRVTSRGVGSAQPIVPNDTPTGKAQKRRVEITVG